MPDLLAALDRIECGAEPSRAEAEALLHARGADLDRLLAVAGRIRDEGLVAAGRPGVITYSRKVFIPLTYLCQDRCHYCTFVQTPGKLAAAGKPTYLSAEEVLQIAREGAALGCKEALFTLGDRPENRWKSARDWLDAHGYESTIGYVATMAKLVLEETGLLAHLNPGVMTWAELQQLRPVAPSMGMMLETTATRLWSEKGGAHYGSPDKDPAVRMRVLEDAGRSKVPFTTGVLLGIGENYAERIDAVYAIRDVGDRFGHVQEVIVQNFRAKTATAMMNSVDLETQEYAAAVAVTRVLLGSRYRIQTPPNLTDAAELSLLVRAGIDDWGGVSPLTPDHVNPERPWPHIDDLARLTADTGYELRERLTAHPHYLRDPEWLDPHLLPHVTALIDDATGLAREDAVPVGRPWSDARAPHRAAPSSATRGALARAEASPAGLSDADYLTLLAADGPDLDELVTLADTLRRERVGDAVTFVVNRNLDSSLLAGTTGRGLTLDDVRDLAAEAAALGATEICMQGAVHPSLPGSAYLDLARAVKDGAPDIHLHAVRPTEIADGAARLGLSRTAFLRELAAAGVDTVPGTGARILDDAVRSTLAGPSGDLPVSEWIDIVSDAHRAGLRSTATMIYGHVESPRQQLAHLRTLARMQDDTGGFTEFIPMPFVPSEFPDAVARAARPGPSLRETRALHAVARLVLLGRIDNIQAAWTKLGFLATREVLRGGANDLGGLLVSGTRAPTAGAEAGRELTRAIVARLAGDIGRPVRERTTGYTPVPAHSVAVAP